MSDKIKVSLEKTSKSSKLIVAFRDAGPLSMEIFYDGTRTGVAEMLCEFAELVRVGV